MKRLAISQPIHAGLDPGACCAVSTGGEPAGRVPLGVIRLVFVGLAMGSEDRTCDTHPAHTGLERRELTTAPPTIAE